MKKENKTHNATSKLQRERTRNEDGILPNQNRANAMVGRIISTHIDVENYEIVM